jgi:hypothetical protein
MYRFILVASLISTGLASGCFFAKEAPPVINDSHVGGSIMLPACGYTVTTQNYASIPQFGTAFLGPDPKPKFVHLNIAKDAAHGIAIVWRTNDETTLASTVQYGENGKLDQTENGFTFVYDSASLSPRIHEAHLCTLKPDTEYSYRVGGSDGNGNESWSPTYTFRTAPDPANAATAMVTLLILGDTRDGYSNWGMELKTAFQMMQPDLIIFTGDETTLGPLQGEWDSWFAAAQDQLPLVPMIVAHGNHEVSSVNYFSQFALPNDEQNYAIDFGPVHISIANDSPTVAADLSGSIAQTLDANVSAGTRAPWNIAVHHKPMWTAAAGPHPEDALAPRMAFQPIFDKYKVDMVFNGHDHDYERSKPMRGMNVGNTPADGTIYVVAGSSGAPLYDNGSQFWTAYSEKTYSFNIVRVRKGMLTMNAYHADGTPLDSLTISK